MKWQNDVLTIYDEVYDYFHDIIDVRRKTKFPFTKNFLLLDQIYLISL